MSVITRDDGSFFPSVEERNEKIVSYFENIYKKPDNDLTLIKGCIENFLGDDIVNSEIIRNSKLTHQEREELDLPLSVLELDKSIEKCYVKSAPGADGLSNIFLKKYWHLLRDPLHKYALKCFEKVALTTNFRSAVIKLIPKKGQPELLKNWRPISLLSNLYKITSRAINSRLNKIVNRICSRAQKGFNDKRFTQECLINVWESIQYCNEKNIDGAIVACLLYTSDAADE